MGKRILIIEDETGLQITLEDRLLAEGYEVCIRSDGISGEDEARTEEYDLILLDLMLPGRDGFSVCQNLRKAAIQTPILMLTARNGNLDTIVGLKQGADDYLGKPFDMGILLARMEALLRRSAPGCRGRSSRAVSFGDFRLNLKTGELCRGEASIELHAKEFALLEFLVRNPNQMLSRDRILNEVWGYESEVTTRTVDVHVAKLRQKLGESELPRHIQTVRGRGYRFIP